MRHIAVLSDVKVPRDTEYNFRERAEQLVKKWQQILNANKSNGAPSSQPTSAAPISAPLSKPDTEEKQEAVTQGTAAISLNGNPTEGEYKLRFFLLLAKLATRTSSTPR